MWPRPLRTLAGEENWCELGRRKLVAPFRAMSFSRLAIAKRTREVPLIFRLQACLEIITQPRPTSPLSLLISQSAVYSLPPLFRSSFTPWKHFRREIIFPWFSCFSELGAHCMRTYLLNTIQSSKLRFFDLGKNFGRNLSVIGMR